MNMRHAKKFMCILCIYNLISLVFGVLQFETGINPNIISNYIRLLIGFISIVLFLINIKKIKYTSLEVFLFVYPIISVIIGVLFSNIGKYLFIDTFNIYVFLIIFKLSSITNFNEVKYNVFFKRIANFYYYLMVIVIFLAYIIFPKLGLSSGAVGILSVSFLIPISYDIAKGSRRIIASLVFLILGQKRGVIIGGIAELSSILVLDFKIKKRIRFIVSMITIFIIFSLSYIILSNTNYNKYPKVIRPSIIKFQRLNLLDETSREALYNNVRIVEIKNSMRPLLDNKVLLLTGAGPNYLYSYDNFDRNRHNVHFSPINFITRYGIIYTIVIYYLIFKVLIKHSFVLKRNEDTLTQRFFLAYFIGGFINSLTAFTVYSDYWWIIAFGFLIDYKKIRRSEDEIINIS